MDVEEGGNYTKEGRCHCMRLDTLDAEGSHRTLESDTRNPARNLTQEERR